MTNWIFFFCSNLNILYHTIDGIKKYILNGIPVGWIKGVGHRWTEAVRLGQDKKKFSPVWSGPTQMSSQYANEPEGL